jgi:threonine dehydrogenase-like Zn-dependent dehydrogenase
MALVREAGSGVGVRNVKLSSPPRFRILRAGICGTDLQICRRVRPDGASILGHEGVAEQIGEPDGRRRFVVFNPVDPVEQDAILGHSYDGVFQRFFSPRPPRVPASLTVASDLVADLAVLIEPLAAVLYGWELVRQVSRPGTVAVFGAGSAALLAALVGELIGVRTIVVHRRLARLAFLREHKDFPAERLVLPADLPPDSVDAAFLCVPREGAAAALDVALSAVRSNGVIDLLGGFAPGDRHPDLGDLDLGGVRRQNVCGRPAPGTLVTSKHRQIRLTGHRGTSLDHLAAAERLLLAHPRRFGALVTHVLSLEAAAGYLSRASAPADARGLSGEPIKVVIDPTIAGGPGRAPDLTTTLEKIGGGA